MAMDAIVAMPAAKPSRPSIRFTVFTKPMIQKMVSGSDMISGK